jgi:acyl carrier protein
MNNDKLIGILEQIAKDTFKTKKISFDRGTQLENIAGWNSLSHVMFMDAVEKKFDVKFSFEEILGLTSIEGICQTLERNKK